MTPSTSCRFIFDSFLSAAQALLIVLEDARTSKVSYEFTGLTTQQIRTSGLTLSGDISAIADKLERVPGAARYDD